MDAKQFVKENTFLGWQLLTIFTVDQDIYKHTSKLFPNVKYIYIGNYSPYRDLNIK